MRQSITTGIIVLAVLFVGYHVADAIKVAHESRTFGSGLRQELEAIGTENAPVQTKAQKDAAFCAVMEELGQANDFDVCNK